MTSQKRYLYWQTKLKSNNLYRYWWQFWSNYAFIFFIPAFAWIGTQGKPQEVIVTCALSFFAARLIITTIINILYHRERPYQKYKFEPLTSIFFSFKTASHNSFPSRHTTTYASVAFTIFAFYPVLGLAMIGVTLLTGMARVVLGYHYPTDILAGFIIGALTGLMLAWAGPLALFT